MSWDAPTWKSVLMLFGKKAGLRMIDDAGLEGGEIAPAGAAGIDHGGYAGAEWDGGESKDNSQEKNNRESKNKRQEKQEGCFAWQSVEHEQKEEIIEVRRCHWPGDKRDKGQYKNGNPRPGEGRYLWYKLGNNEKMGLAREAGVDHRRNEGDREGDRGGIPGPRCGGNDRRAG